MTNLDQQLKKLPKESVSNNETDTSNKKPKKKPKPLQVECREQIENLHSIFVCWFKGSKPKEELEKELIDRMTPGFSHIAPNGQFLKGISNLLFNLSDKYNAYKPKDFDIQIDNVKIIWHVEDLVLVTYEEWQWWRDKDSNDDLIKFGRLSSCLMRQRPKKFHWIHVHETWLEGIGPNEMLKSLHDSISQMPGKDTANATTNDDASSSSGSYNVEMAYKTGKVGGKSKKGTEAETVGAAGTAELDPQKATANTLGEGDSAHKVRFSSEREEVSYSYKKTPHHPSSSQQQHQPSSNNSNASKRRHISPRLTEFAKACMVGDELIGISIHGWDIGTGQGPMGDESWFTTATNNFEKIAQYRYQDDKEQNSRRRLTLPEMVFPAAHVAFEHRQTNIFMSWDVLDALDYWAKAHQEIPLNSEMEHNGVSVLKTKDAELWASKQKFLATSTTSNNADVFHSDWTFSTPFCGSVEGGTWAPLARSGLKLDLLKDKSVPILFFDEVILYEDDLHDNGQVQFSLKIRVMPTCAFVLSRLWVRIDKVLLRLRETRLMIDFQGSKGGDHEIYRDVTWRECPWKELAKHKLPDNVKVWCREGPETPQQAQLMSKLPEVSPPDNIPKYAKLKMDS